MSSSSKILESKFGETLLDPVQDLVLQSATMEADTLRNSQMLSGILENLPVIVFRIDSNGYFTEAMGSGIKRLKITAKDIVGRPVLEGFPEVKDYLERALRGQTVVCESHGVNADGEPWWLQNYLFFDSLCGSGSIGFALDITERKLAEENKRRMEEQLIRVQKMESLGLLARGIAHDFNNILMAVLGNASIALEKLPPQSNISIHLKKIELAAQRAAEICAHMLNYSGKSEPGLEFVHLPDLIEETISLLRVSIPKNVAIGNVLYEEKAYVQADSSQLRQIVMNLLTNAADAVGCRAGEIKIKVGTLSASREYLSKTHIDDQLPAGRYAYVEISDTGCGMDQPTLSRIFDPFFSTKFAGRGLGLATVLGIVRSHKGAIECESVLGSGTVFRVLFPASDRMVNGPIKDVPNRSFGKIVGRVLVIDDDEMSRDIIQSMLSHAGASVISAKDGFEALSIFDKRRHEINLIILDFIMPVMSGDEVLRRIRKIDSQVPVLMTSAYDQKEVYAKVKDLNPSGFIQKPYHKLSFLQKLTQVLQQYTV